MNEMINLVPAIHEIEKIIAVRKSQFMKEIEPYQQSLESLRKINEACEVCGGAGKKLRSRSCAEDERPDPNDPKDWEKCQFCGGTGVKKQKEEIW